MCTLCGWAKAFSLGKGGLPTRRDFVVAGVAAAGTAVTGASARAAGLRHHKADFVFTNGVVYTVNPRQAWAEAVAVAGNTIVYVGENAGVTSYVGSRTRVIDLRGRMLLPGFVEGHIHPFAGAAIVRGVDLQYDSLDETLEALRAYAKTNQDRVVRGFGWRYNAFPPTGPRKEELDAIWPDRPAFLTAVDGHSAWVNSKALQIAAITKATQDPVPGFSYFERDRQTREPTGYLVEVPAMVQVLKVSEPITLDAVAAGLAQWLPRAAAAGITAVFDAGIIVTPEEAAFGHYADLENRGMLPFRVVGCHYHNDPKVDPIPIIAALRQKYHTELVRASVLKLNIDGGDPQYTAAMLEPYSDKPDTRGELLLAPDLLKKIVREADRAGIDLHCHSFGDRATRVTLDAIEEAVIVNGPRDRRHALAHLVYVNNDDIPRFAKLGIIAQFSAQWSVPDASWSAVTKVRWGARADRMYPCGAIARSGARIALGTDWPAAAYHSTYKPLDAIEVATTRRPLGKTDGAALPPAEERINLAQALHANTLGAAYQLRLDQETGSIETGKRADLVVLDQNLFRITPHEIHYVTVAMTMMNGRFTHGPSGV